jgi:hypothetical protein
MSFLSQIYQLAGGVFSYCLPSSGTTSRWLEFGPGLEHIVMALHGSPCSTTHGTPPGTTWNSLALESEPGGCPSLKGFSS